MLIMAPAKNANNVSAENTKPLRGHDGEAGAMAESMILSWNAPFVFTNVMC